MTLTPDLYALVTITTATAMMWFVYIPGRILERGLRATFANPDPRYPADPPWVARSKSAHANAVENLVVFAPLVLIGALIGANTPLSALLAQTYVVARLIHFLAYTAGIPVVRTLAFLTGSAATIGYALVLLLHS
jgi:uncharacterized MAPEG superfamily protein